MIKINKTVTTQKKHEVDVQEGIYFLQINEGDIFSLCKLELDIDGYKFTRLVKDGPNKAIIYKVGTDTLPWVVEQYFTNNIYGGETNEEKFNEFKTELLKEI
jgi:hypothetical protein